MSGEAQLAAVKEYIAKYNLEDELSNGVNLAIKQNSDDPFRVISDYLRTLAKDGGDEEEEDDDDIIHEGEEEPMPVNRGRRQQVVAAKVEVPTGWKPKVVPKDDASATFLKDAMKSNRLMKSLAPSDREQLMMAFEKVDYEPGSVIIKQGDPGDKFYILDEGTCDISIEGKGSVMKATKGIAFGELALLHNAPRAATVTAETKATAWYIDELTFKTILMGKSQQDAIDYVAFLQGVPILKSLTPEQIQELAGSLKEAEYGKDKLIIAEGDEGNSFFIIRDGEVKCTKMGKAEEVSRRLKRGDFFGELALLSSDKRAASVTAVTDTTVLMIARAEFTRLLGSLSEIIESSAAYNK
eukprot:CAMPEP_0174733464 /NCGR_PEP_ID=MMETSP1094-20130205/61362_1 /TAXON_ID=156173 /ORGANISM="Chrysochromulina brevifilum, Strain UTEX LB 985" /LENGTH=353 /DNA_ID=CAMNT_0015936123 /DNA_START=41 /DNA_END=1102 /DNA_ORIENTATION=+